MNEFDEQIRNALKEAQGDLFDDDDDMQAHFESLKYMFRGKTKWFSLVHLAVIAVFLTGMAVCAVQFFQADSIRAQIGWATGFLAFFIVEALGELYFMMEWNKHVVRWEIKHLELQIASLASGIRDEAD